MKRKNKNVFLLLILLILIIVTIVVIFIFKSKENKGNTPQIEEKTETEDTSDRIIYDNGNLSYFDSFEKGKLDINIKECVKLPTDYSKYKPTDGDNIEYEINSILQRIVDDSQVDIPIKLLNGYYGDTYSSMDLGAKINNIDLDEYIKKEYGYDTYQKFAEENIEYFRESIKEDLVYQALGEELNITVNREDIEKFYSERLANGDTYESLKKHYGENLMYKYTAQDKLKKALIQKLS